MERVSIVGPGRLGGALAIALSRAGLSIDRIVYSSRPPSASLVEKIEGDPAILRADEITALDSDLILLTTPDTELSAVASSIAPKIAAGSVLLHASGALSSEVLAPAAVRGVATGSMHPLVSVSDPAIGADNFSGAFFCVEGDPAALAAAERLVDALGGTPFSIDTRFKPLYHASALLVSGHLTALFAVAVDTLTRCGVDERKAQEVLLPLAESALLNLSKLSPAEALTGPFARTDPDAIGRHLEAFDRTGLADEKKIYLELGLKALQLAEAGGRDGANIERIRNVIKLAQGSGK